MFTNLLTVSIDEGSLNITLSLWAFVLIAIVLICLIYWRKISGYFKSDITLKLRLGSAAEVTIKPNYQVKQIAHKVWVELTTRKAGLPIDKENDVISDIYKSWYELFGEIRSLARDIPASKLNDPNTRKLVDLLITTLNEGLRPHLTRWRAKYEWWYEDAIAKSKRDELSPQELQSKYPEYNELVKDMMSINKKLVEYTREIKRLVDA